MIGRNNFEKSSFFFKNPLILLSIFDTIDALTFKKADIKEVQTMAVVYATLIIKGKKTLDQVPALIKPQVEEILKDLEVEV